MIFIELKNNSYNRATKNIATVCLNVINQMHRNFPIWLFINCCYNFLVLFEHPKPFVLLNGFFISLELHKFTEIFKEFTTATEDVEERKNISHNNDFQ